jgi:hypothetical protein
MKTAISLPDELFERVTSEARRLGISRSELFATAARRYLAELSRQDLVQQIDAALPTAGADESHRAVVPAGRSVLGRTEW